MIGVDHREPGPALGEISSGSWLEAAYRRRGGRVVAEAVFAGRVDLSRVGLAGGDIGVEALATQLVIGRCVTHPRHRRGAPTGTASTPCGQLVGTVHRWCTGCGNRVDGSRTTRNPTHRPVTLGSSDTHQRHHTLTRCRFATMQPTDPHQPGDIVHQRLVVTTVTDTARSSLAGQRPAIRSGARKSTPDHPAVSPRTR